jgi:hypothetical protein
MTLLLPLKLGMNEASSMEVGGEASSSIEAGDEWKLAGILTTGPTISA